jgi:hypothetical protein
MPTVQVAPEGSAPHVVPVTLKPDPGVVRTLVTEVPTVQKLRRLTVSVPPL